MELLDVPPEVFQCIIHSFVNKVGPVKAWKARVVCRTFAAEIYYDVFANQPLAAFKTSVSKRILNSNMGLFLINRNKKPLDVHPYLPSLVKYCTDEVISITSDELDTKQREAMRVIADYIPTYLGSFMVYRLLGNSISAQRPNPGDAVNLPNENDKLPAAALIGNLEVVKSLLDKGLSIWNEPVALGYPLRAAAAGGHADVVKFILNVVKEETSNYNSGAEEREKNAQKGVMIRSAIDAVIIGENTEIFELLQSFFDSSQILTPTKTMEAWFRKAVDTGKLEIFKRCMGMRIDGCPRAHLDAFYYACKRGEKQMVECFLDKKYNVRYKGRYWSKPSVKSVFEGNFTPLGIAAAHGHVSVAESLLMAGASVNPPYYNNICCGRLPIVLAAKNGHEEMVRFLIDWGAELNPYNHPCLMQAAREGGDVTIYKLLRRKRSERGVYRDSGHQANLLGIST
ncbi:ankyrin [Zopfia rhizophila CBS 207.26]|uniref:Ankyrin n=1 Tax=Zopfia rhizophila CBS 207.26 TaxID=1314779 RepID=A0A6A6DZ07_9PEZI|nr:ankyrin [Zopfia rhizophila CBS 207.26]